MGSLEWMMRSPSYFCLVNGGSEVVAEIGLDMITGLYEYGRRKFVTIEAAKKAAEDAQQSQSFPPWSGPRSAP